MSTKSSSGESQNFEVRVNVVQYLVLAIFVVLAIRFSVLRVPHTS